MKVREVKLPQHDGDSLEGNIVTLDDDGVFAVNGYDGFTRLTSVQALLIAAMLTEWAERQ